MPGAMLYHNRMRQKIHTTDNQCSMVPGSHKLFALIKQENIAAITVVTVCKSTKKCQRA